MVVAEAPGKTECDFGRPLIGDTGQELQRNISAMGYKRADFSYSNALICRPPGNELGRLMHAWKEENKIRKAKYGKEGLLPSPIACCRPRLYRELVNFENIITLGNAPIQSILCTEQYSITALRGGPITGFLSPAEFAVDEAFAGEGFRPVKILPTFHPSFVLRQRKWTRTLRTDLGRAMRWFTGSLNWREPVVVIHPTVAQIRTFLDEKVRWNTWDLETTMDDPLVAEIFCFGIGHRHADGTRHAIVIPFHSKERGTIAGAIGHPDFYTEDQFTEIVDILRRWLVAPGRWKIGHNSMIFDSTVVQGKFGVYPKPQHDTLAMHRAVESELPHGLGYIGTTYTDVTAWKADKSGTEAKTDLELHKYNGIDCIITDDIVEPLAEAVKLRDQKEVVKKDYRFLQEACVGMHRLGMRVNVERRDFYDKQFLYAAVKWRNIIREVVNIASFNPGSVQQIKDILFDRWGLPPVEISELTGEPSTGDDCLRQYRISFNLTRQQRQFIEALRKYRNAIKMRGTDVVKYRRFDELMPPDDFWEDTEETKEEFEYRREKDEKKHGILLADGRVHASWNQLTTSGRANCTQPNMQNKRRKYRDMYEPEPTCKYCKEPHVYVSADMDQLELRGSANRWKLSRYLEVLKEGRDPHAETALAAMGDAARKILAQAEEWAKQEKGRKAKNHSDWKRLRDFSKRFFYACQYRAEDPTVYDVLTSVEDDDGNLIYADLDMATVRERRANLLNANPEFPAGWEWEVSTWRKQGYLCEPVWGRRRDFLNGEEPNEIVNFPIQAMGRAIVMNAEFAAIEAIPYDKWCPYTGLVHDGHDSVMFEVPLSKAEWTKNTLNECMQQRVPGHEVPYTAEAHIGVCTDSSGGPVGRRSWADV